VIGYEKSEQLDVKPTEYLVVVTKREKRSCKDCEEQGVECAPAPVRIIEKGLAIRIVVQMNELFAIDAQARDEDLSQMDRHLLRMEKSKPLLDQIKTTMHR
jgi:zinc-finger binding domain of transposase IS66